MRPLLSADVLPAGDLQAGLPESVYVSTFVLQTHELLQQRSGVLRSSWLRPLVRSVVCSGSGRVCGPRSGVCASSGWLRGSGSGVCTGSGRLRGSGSRLCTGSGWLRCSRSAVLRSGSGPGDLCGSGSGDLLCPGSRSGDLLCSGSGPGQVLRSSGPGQVLRHRLQQRLQQGLRFVLWQAEVLQC